MIRIIITILFLSSASFAAGTSYDDDNSSTSASEQVTKLYNKAYELVYDKKFDKSIKLLEKIAERKDLGEKKADVFEKKAQRNQKRNFRYFDAISAILAKNTFCLRGRHIIPILGHNWHSPTLENLLKIY